jgi:hypothetical protein
MSEGFGVANTVLIVLRWSFPRWIVNAERRIKVAIGMAEQPYFQNPKISFLGGRDGRSMGSYLLPRSTSRVSENIVPHDSGSQLTTLSSFGHGV